MIFTFTTLQLKNGQKVNADTVKKMLADDKSEVIKTQFTGTAYFSPKLTYKAGDTENIKYRLCTYGGSSEEDKYQFILMMPSGFDAGTLNFSPNPDNSYNHKIKNLGYVGPNGEQTYLVTLYKKPDFNNTLPQGFLIDITMTANGRVGGKFTYDQNNELVYSLADDMVNQGDGYGAHKRTISLGYTTYNLVGTPTPFNLNQWTTSSYTIVPSNKPLVSSKYQLTNIKVTAKDGTTEQDPGYEELDATLKLPDHPTADERIQDGDYIDFKLGLPYKDENGNEQILPYDTVLANQDTLKDHGDLIYKGVTFGHLYKMGTYYRTVFNSNIDQFYSNADGANFYNDFSLKWAIKPYMDVYGHQHQQKGSVNDGKVFVYQYTDNKEDKFKEIQILS